MSLNETAKNTMLDTLKTKILYISLHDETGTELSGGSPAYARQAVTFGASAAGEMVATNTPSFDIPPGTIVASVKYFDSLTGGTDYGGFDTVDETFTSQGEYNITNLTINLNK